MSHVFCTILAETLLFALGQRRLESSRMRFLARSQNLRRATVSFFMSARMFVHMEQIGFHWTDFYEISHLKVFRKHLEKIQVLLNSDKNNGYF